MTAARRQSDCALASTRTPPCEGLDATTGLHSTVETQRWQSLSSEGQPRIVRLIVKGDLSAVTCSMHWRMRYHRIPYCVLRIHVHWLQLASASTHVYLTYATCMALGCLASKRFLFQEAWFKKNVKLQGACNAIIRTLQSLFKRQKPLASCLYATCYNRIILSQTASPTKLQPTSPRHTQTSAVSPTH